MTDKKIGSVRLLSFRARTRTTTSATVYFLPQLGRYARVPGSIVVLVSPICSRFCNVVVPELVKLAHVHKCKESGTEKIG